MRRILFGASLGLTLAASVTAIAAGSPADNSYGSSLSRVYAAHQSLLALREACDQAAPGEAAANDKAYAAWQSRHRSLLEELDTRFTLMVKGVSRHEREYLRNLGKYEGALIENRNRERDQLLAQPRAELALACADFRAQLAGTGLDFRKEFAEELRVIRLRKLPD